MVGDFYVKVFDFYLRTRSTSSSPNLTFNFFDGKSSGLANVCKDTIDGKIMNIVEE